MKTSLDIPKKELEDALKFTGAKTKTEAVTLAVKDYNRRVRLNKLSKKLGTFDAFISTEELSQLRSAQ